MNNPTSYIGALRNDLNTIRDLMVELLASSQIIRETEERNPFLSLGTGRPPPPKVKYSWDELTPEQQTLQNEILQEYEKWFHRFNILVGKAIPKQNQIEYLNLQINQWINYRQCNNKITNRPNAIRDFNSLVDEFQNELTLIENSHERNVILIPDTNFLTEYPDIPQYKSIIDEDGFVFIITPTVLSEIDDHKLHHPNENYQNKCKAVIKRIKGWRNQGDLHSGITVDKTITVRALAIEPKFDSLPDWLDRQNNDDRIIASIIEIQIEYPASVVYLITLDENLKNKAAMAQIPYLEPPTNN